MRTTTLAMFRSCVRAIGSGSVRGHRLTGHLRDHRLILLRALYLLQLSEKLLGGRKTEHISLLLDSGS